MIDYLTLVEVLAIHEDQIELYGGAPGIRDYGLIESALFRPQTGYYEDVIAQAAALWESFAQNHPFVDGNKRTAFAVTYTFLAINHVKLRAGADETYDFIIGSYESNTFDYEHLRKWLYKHCST